MPDTIHDHFDSPTAADISPKGSIYINNTSYSGVDIKVLLHVYTPIGTASARVLSFRNDIEATREALELQRKRLSEAEAGLESTHTGTRENNRFANIATRSRMEIESNESLLQSLFDQAQEIGIRPEKTTKALAELQTISISTYRDKQDVMALGHVAPKGITRGPRIIAGSMIWTVFNEHILYEFLDSHPSDFDGESWGAALMDQLPPVDLTIVAANEYGHISRMTLFGVEFMNESTVMSIEDILTESQCQIKIRSWDPLRRVMQRKVDTNNILMSSFGSKKASDLIFEEDYQYTKGMLDPFERLKRRRSPYK